MCSKDKKIQLIRLLFAEGCIDRDEYDYMLTNLKDEGKKEDTLSPPPKVY